MLQCLLKPAVKESTKPIDPKLHTDIRAIDRAEFDQQVPLSFISSSVSTWLPGIFILVSAIFCGCTYTTKLSLNILTAKFSWATDISFIRCKVHDCRHNQYVSFDGFVII